MDILFKKSPLLKLNTRKRKESRRVFERLYGREELTDRVYRIIFPVKKRLDALLLVGKLEHPVIKISAGSFDTTYCGECPAFPTQFSETCLKKATHQAACIALKYLTAK